MRTHMTGSIGLVLALWASSAAAQDIVWQTATPKPAPAVSLGQPQRLTPVAADEPSAPTSNVGLDLPRVVRGQSPPPAPAFPGSPGGSAPFTPVPGPGGSPYACGVANNDADLGGFWSRFCDKTKRCWDDISGGAGRAFQSSPGHKPFQSDREFEFFTSPVSNPFYFEDPRALTEVRPIFMWQHTPGANPVWNGGNNFFLGGRGSVAFTENITLNVSKLGFDWIGPNIGTPDISSHSGFDEIHLGPKITFYRNRDTRTVWAGGVNFEIASGSAKVLQDTGRGSIEPYFSVAQGFGRSSYGSFNFMNTTGYDFRVDNVRSEPLFSSFHLDYNIGDLNRFFPLAEINWRHYTRNGSARNLNFEGSDFANFGSTTISGYNELTLALGGRIRLNSFIDLGLVGEFNVLNNSGGRHLDQFRLTTDLIFRY